MGKASGSGLSELAELGQDHYYTERAAVLK
jgi:hypothetical protein